jgi:large repetitive protein
MAAGGGPWAPRGRRRVVRVGASLALPLLVALSGGAAAGLFAGAPAPAAAAGTANAALAAKHLPTLTGIAPSTGIAGTSVTLTGTYLFAETAVHFGTAESTSVKVKSADELIATAPPGKGTVAVSVTTPSGTSNTEPFSYDAPAVTSLTPQKGWPGATVTIHGSGFSATAEVLFYGKTVTGATVKSSRAVSFSVPALATKKMRTVTVLVRTAAGTSSPASFTYLPTAPLKVATTSLPGAITTQRYVGATLGASGGTGHYSWSAGSGFPSGLSLTTVSGAISGREGKAGTYGFSVTVKDGHGKTASKTLSIEVTPGPFEITTASLPTASLDTPYGASVSDDPFVWFPTPLHYTNWVAAGLPTGLSITASYGTISGTPTEAGTFRVAVTVTLLGTYFATRTFTLLVQGFHITTTRTAAFTSTFYDATTATGPATLAAATATGTVHWSATGLPGALSITATSGTVSGVLGKAGAAVGTYTFTATATDSGATTSRQVSLRIAQGPFIVTTAGVTPGSLGSSYTAVLPAVQPVPPPGGYTTWSATGLPPGLSIGELPTYDFGRISGTPTETGTFRVTVTDENVGAFFEVVTFTLVVYAFQITTPKTLAGWTTELSFPTITGPTQLAAAGGTGHYTWSAGSGFPAGMTLTSTGKIEATAVTGFPGAPVASGTYDFTVTAKDGQGATAEKTFTLKVTQGTFHVTPAAAQKADASTGYTLFLGENSPTRGLGTTLWFATGLPAGLVIAESGTYDYGVVYGTPTTPGTYSVTARDYAASLWASTQFTITVYPALSITTTSLAYGTKYVPYSTQTLAATGGTGAGTYTWSATGLPPGLHITASAGTISGTPTQPTGAFTYTKVHVTVHDGADGSVTKSFTLLVYANISMLSPGEGKAGTKATATVTGSFPSARVVWNGALLPGSAKVSTGKTVVPFVVPPGSGTPTVYVLLQGTTASTSTRFAYTATPGLFQTTPPPSGKTGTRVQLRGSGFVAGDTVTFTTGIPDNTPVFFGNGTPETVSGVTVTAPTTLTVAVPKENGATVWLYITAPGGARSNEILFTFAYAPHIVAAFWTTGTLPGNIALFGNGFTVTVTMTMPTTTCPLTHNQFFTQKTKGEYALYEGHQTYAPATTFSGVIIDPPTQSGFCGMFSFTEGVHVTNRFGTEFLAFNTFAALDTKTLHPPKPTPQTKWSELFGTYP